MEKGIAPTSLGRASDIRIHFRIYVIIFNYEEFDPISRAIETDECLSPQIISHFLIRAIFQGFTINSLPMEKDLPMNFPTL
jgi:hypothetical protein